MRVGCKLVILAWAGVLVHCGDTEAMDPGGAGASGSAAVGATGGSGGASGGGGSGGGGMAEPRSLIDHEAWTLVEAADDPFTDRPDSVTCEQTAYGAELLSNEDVFFVQTQMCDYLTVEQSTLEDIQAGDTIKLRFWHFQLTAPADSETHAALELDGESLWETRIPIPQDSGALISEELTAARDIPAGSRLVYHLHNHGSNEYLLIELSI